MGYLKPFFYTEFPLCYITKDILSVASIICYTDAMFPWLSFNVAAFISIPQKAGILREYDQMQVAMEGAYTETKIEQYIFFFSQVYLSCKFSLLWIFFFLLLFSMDSFCKIQYWSWQRLSTFEKKKKKRNIEFSVYYTPLKCE